MLAESAEEANALREHPARSDDDDYDDDEICPKEVFKPGPWNWSDVVMAPQREERTSLQTSAL